MCGTSWSLMSWKNIIFNFNSEFQTVGKAAELIFTIFTATLCQLTHIKEDVAAGRGVKM